MVWIEVRSYSKQTAQLTHPDSCSVSAFVWMWKCHSQLSLSFCQTAVVIQSAMNHSLQRTRILEKKHLFEPRKYSELNIALSWNKLTVVHGMTLTRWTRKGKTLNFLLGLWLGGSVCKHTVQVFRLLYCKCMRWMHFLFLKPVSLSTLLDLSCRTHLWSRGGGASAETGSVQSWNWEETTSGETHWPREGKSKNLTETEMWS